MVKIVNMIFNRIKEIEERYYFTRSVNHRPLKIVIGAGGVSRGGWVSSEKDYLNLLCEKDWVKYFRENSIDALLAEHVWEHLTKKQGALAARICFKYLRNGGRLRVAVPDGFFPDKKYIEHVKPGSRDPDASEHKVLYTYKSFTDLFRRIGFKVVLLEYFDGKGRFHYKKWNKKDGMIIRSRRFDARNLGGNLNYTSIILDAVKQ